MLGTLLSPFVVGFVVEGGGHAAAFGTAAAAYALLALVGARLPAPDPQARPEPPPSPQVGAPRLASRGMALVLLGTFLRFACGSLRLAFFPLYLAGLGYSPLAIGLLVGLGNLVSVGGAPLARPLLARLGSPRLLYVALCVGLTALALTPLGTGALPLVGLAALWGLGMGLSLPALLQQIADGTRREDRGLAIGLRQTVNEAAALSTPVALGLISTRIGIEGGFYAVGGGLALLALGGLVCATGPALRRACGGSRPQHQLPEVLAAERLR
jgi:MFS family permease